MRRFRLALSIARSNKGFSVALLLLYALMMSLLALVTVLNPTLDATFEEYFDDYRMPDAYITSEPAPSSAVDEMAGLEGVAGAEARFVIDATVEFPGGGLATVRFIAVDEDTLLKFRDVERDEVVALDADGAMVSAYFADRHGLREGDELVLKSAGDGRIEVAGIVSCPETISAVRDDNAWYDTTGFGFVYLERERFDELFATEGLANQFLLWTEDGHEEDEALLDAAASVEDIEATDSFLFKGSPVEEQIHASLDTAQAVATYLPGVILIIGALMSALFINQVVRASSKWIGLFEALGYSPARILLNFIAYTLLLVIVAAVIGAVVGFMLLHSVCGFYQDYYYLPYIEYAASPIRIAVLPLLLALVGVLSCMLSVRLITGVDPATVYSGTAARHKSELPGWLSRINLKTYGKITACFMYRNVKRIVLSSLCIASCLVLLIMVISFDISKDEAVTRTFGERMQYDFLVSAESEEALDEIAALGGVGRAEKAIVFTEEIGDEKVRFNAIEGGSSLIRLHDAAGAPCEPAPDGVLLEEGFAKRSGLEPGDVLEIGNEEVHVSGVAREFVNCICYVSFAQAEKLGHGDPNALFVRLAEGADRDAFIREATEVDGFGYAVDTRNQRHDMEEAMGILDYPSAIFIAFALVVGLVIICNMMIISVSERRREYATLLVTGAEKRRFLQMVAVETLGYYLIACIIGCPLGVAASGFVLGRIGSATQDFPMVDTPFVLLVSCAVTLALMVVSVAYAMRAISKIRPESILNERA